MATANAIGSGQTLDSASSPTFTGLNLSSLTASQLVVTDASKNIASSTAPAAGVMPDTVYFGDGSDGAFTLSDGSTTTLDRDRFYSSITLTANSKINTNGWKLFCSGTTSIASGSSINFNGNNASGQTAGATLTNHSIGGSSAGGNGGNTSTNGSNGSVGATAVGGSGGRGADSATNTGGSAGTQTIPNNNYYLPMSFGSAATGLANNQNSGAGGGGGAGNASIVGGGGGGGGGILYLATQTLSGTGTVEAKGGNGGNTTSTAGVGAGGGGGVVLLFYRTFSGGFTSAQVDVSVGSSGTGGATTNLTAGTAGRKFIYQV